METTKKVQSRRKRIKSLIVAGYTVEEIKQMCSFTDEVIFEFFRTLKSEITEEELAVFNDPHKPVWFGAKTEPYYKNEDDVLKKYQNYSYESLSGEEKDIYNNIIPMCRI
jgi:hypothetical protein